MNKNKSLFFFLLSCVFIISVHGCMVNDDYEELRAQYDEIYRKDIVARHRLTLTKEETVKFLKEKEELFNLEKIYNKFGAGYHEFMYVFYLNEEAEIDHILPEKSMGKQQDERVINWLRNYSFKVRFDGEKQVKHQARYRFSVTFDNKGNQIDFDSYYNALEYEI
jgi:hypothetical protein